MFNGRLACRGEPLPPENSLLKFDYNAFRISNERSFALGLPYKQEVRGSSPRPPTNNLFVSIADSLSAAATNRLSRVKLARFGRYLVGAS
jgi:hypothetical protein